MTPNIILIMSDNHPADLLGCYGNPEIHTPHINKLACEGMQFNNAFCVNAMCSPCRASVLTGLMPSQHGIHTWIDDRRMEKWPPHWNSLADLATLPEILKDNSYDTALIGKYHLGNPFAPQNGFDHWVTFPHGHTRSFWGNEIIENGTRGRYDGHIVDYFTEKAVAYIGEQAKKEAPFFLFLPYNAPYGHWPAIKGQAQNHFAALYEDCPMHSVPREGISREMVERFLLTMADSGDGLDYSATLRIPNDLVSLRNYFSQMSMVDDGVGQVMAALQANGLDENTLVIYTCDHGFSLGQHGFWGHGQATWPSNTHASAYHIPLLLHHKGEIAAAQQSHNLVSQVDLFATLLDYVGVGYSVNDSPSRSFAPLLRGEPLVWTDEVFMEQEETRAIRTERWLYMERFGGAEDYLLPDALYDLASDPDERANLLLEGGEVPEGLNGRLTHFFQQYATPKYDLWQGGTTKSNTSRPWLWPAAWGDEWQPVYD